MATVRLTMAQALTRWMTAQSIEQLDGTIEPAFAGVWGIFGQGYVAGLGEALYGVRDELPTFRGHNEQSRAHIAIAYAKQKQRRRMMAVTTSIGPGRLTLQRQRRWRTSTACRCCCAGGRFCHPCA